MVGPKTAVSVHVLGMTVVRGRGCTGVVRYWVGTWEGYTGWVVLPRGTYDGLPLDVQPHCGFPGESLGGCHGVRKGLLLEEMGVRRAQEGPGVPIGRPTPPQAQYRRDSVKYILKLVNIPECHHKTVMRPAIVPISKNRPQYHDLEFPGFPYMPAFSPKE